MSSMQRSAGRGLLGKRHSQSAVLAEEVAKLIRQEDRASIASGLDAKKSIKQSSTIDQLDFGLLSWRRADQLRQEAKASPARRLQDLMASQEEIPHTEATFACGDHFGKPLTRGGPRTRTLAMSPSFRARPSPLGQHQSRVEAGDSLLTTDLYLERREILTRRPRESGVPGVTLLHGARGSGIDLRPAALSRSSPAKKGGASSGYGRAETKTRALRLRLLNVMA